VITFVSGPQDFCLSTSRPPVSPVLARTTPPVLSESFGGLVTKNLRCQSLMRFPGPNCLGLSGEAVQCMSTWAFFFRRDYRPVRTQRPFYFSSAVQLPRIAEAIPNPV